MVNFGADLFYDLAGQAMQRELFVSFQSKLPLPPVREKERDIYVNVTNKKSIGTFTYGSTYQ